jgi:hypothetical protein
MDDKYMNSRAILIEIKVLLGRGNLAQRFALKLFNDYQISKSSQRTFAEDVKA